MVADRARHVRTERGSTTAEASGFAMLEVLVAIVIAAIGLLGLVGVQARALQSETEAYQRAQALVLLEDMVDLIRTNPKGAGCLDLAGGYVGTSEAGYVDPSGRCGTNATLREGLAEWDSALKGAGESASGTNVGAMIGARGCINLNASSSPNSYTVSVAWQGTTTQKLPTVGASSPVDVQRGIACGSGLYGDASESGGLAHRRVVWITVIPACLNC